MAHTAQHNDAAQTKKHTYFANQPLLLIQAANIRLNAKDKYSFIVNRNPTCVIVRK